MLRLEYSVNSNGKLFNDCFNDIRPSRDYYAVGAEVEIYFKRLCMGAGKIIAVRTFPFTKISDLLAYLNIGYHAAYQAKILKDFNHGQVSQDYKLDQLVVAYTERNFEVQTPLLMSWWNDKTPTVYNDQNHIHNDAT